MVRVPVFASSPAPMPFKATAGGVKARPVSVGV